VRLLRLEGRDGVVADSGFHEGELFAQRRAGVVDEAQRLSGMLTEPVISAGMSRFVAERELAFVTAQDSCGHLWTSPIYGPRGFCTGHGRTLTMTRTVAEGDPLQDLRRGQPVGALLIDFARRRRLRVNGIVSDATADGLELSVEQAFGNCPRYIRPREVTPPDRAAPSRRLAELTSEDVAQIVAADTFILGTIHPERGADTSHRGGEPGFVRHEDGELWWPDHPGNNLFNSLGNLVVNPASALLFLDYERGTCLQLSGRGVLDWTSDDPTGRRVRFVPERIACSH
jgi:predicted pyridoxine 5'-phosphate oxidase superfamily flavin-nucleotide-binding protein